MPLTATYVRTHSYDLNVLERLPKRTEMSRTEVMEVGLFGVFDTPMLVLLVLVGI